MDEVSTLNHSSQRCKPDTCRWFNNSTDVLSFLLNYICSGRTRYNVLELCFLNAIRRKLIINKFNELLGSIWLNFLFMLQYGGLDEY